MFRGKNQYFILETEKNASGNEVFKKERQGKDFAYLAVDTEGNREIVSKDYILRDMMFCANADTSDFKSIRVTHKNDAFILAKFAESNVDNVEYALTSLDSGNSYGSKARYYENQYSKVLVSYGIRQCVIDKQYDTITFTAGGYSNSTMKHIRSFLHEADWCGWDTFYTKQLLKTPLGRPIPRAEFSQICKS